MDYNIGDKIRLKRVNRKTGIIEVYEGVINLRGSHLPNTSTPDISQLRPLTIVTDKGEVRIKKKDLIERID